MGIGDLDLGLTICVSKNKMNKLDSHLCQAQIKEGNRNSPEVYLEVSCTPP